MISKTNNTSKIYQLFTYFQSNNGVYKGNDVLSVLSKLKTTRTNFKKIEKKHMKTTAR